jgi:mono/diheme cytochrome c family protein
MGQTIRIERCQTDLTRKISQMNRFALIFLFFFGCCIVSSPCNAEHSAEQASYFAALLAARCSECHTGAEPSGNFNLAALKAVSEDDESQSDKQWARVFHVLVTAQMPPVDADQMTRAERTRAISWLQGRLVDTGLITEWDRKLLFPEYGNYVDHESLFDGSVSAVGWSPSRLWKKSPYIFDSLADRGMGFRPGRYGSRSSHLTKLKQPFTIEDKAGVKDFAAITFADSATLSTMVRNAETLVDNHLAGAVHERRVLREGPIPEDQLPKDKNGKPIQPRFPATPAEFHTIVLKEDPATDEQVHSAITTMFQLVVERKPSQEELRKYRELMRVCTAEGGQTEGLRMMLIAIAVSPPAVYRLELGQGPVDEQGRQLMAAAELAFAVSYALTDQSPDQSLLEAARSGRLQTREDVAREVARYWDHPGIEKPRILRFFHEFFGYDAAPGVFKDEVRFGKDYRKVPERLVEDADTLVMHIVKQDQNVLAELLTTEKYFVSHSGDNEEEREIHEALQKFYDYYKDKPWRKFPYKVPDEHMTYVRSIHSMFTHANGNVTKRWMKYLEQCDKAGISHMPVGGSRSSGRDYITTYNLDEKSFSYPVEQPFVLSSKERIGILMHPAWLIAHSLNLDNDPVRRGKWIRERLLADTVPELPITVDARIPVDPQKTLRERFAVTREQECWRCHVKMNPLGMPFELFDDFGRHRAEEKLPAKGQSRLAKTTGALVGTGNLELDGDVNDPLELMHRLVGSKRVRQSFVRHAFRYWMGRNERRSDSKTLIQADQAYVTSDGSFRALVISLLTSDSFLYRKVETSAHHASR